MKKVLSELVFNEKMWGVVFDDEYNTLYFWY